MRNVLMLSQSCRWLWVGRSLFYSTLRFFDGWSMFSEVDPKDFDTSGLKECDDALTDRALAEPRTHATREERATWR